MYTLVGTAKLDNVQPRAWFADLLDRCLVHSVPAQLQHLVAPAAGQRRKPDCSGGMPRTFLLASGRRRYRWTEAEKYLHSAPD